MQTPNFYLIEGVAGRWQFWAEAATPEHCWLTPVENASAALAALSARHPEVVIQHLLACVPLALLAAERTVQQPSLF